MSTLIGRGNGSLSNSTAAADQNENQTSGNFWSSGIHSLMGCISNTARIVRAVERSRSVSVHDRPKYRSACKIPAVAAVAALLCSLCSALLSLLCSALSALCSALLSAALRWPLSTSTRPNATAALSSPEAVLVLEVVVRNEAVRGDQDSKQKVICFSMALEEDHVGSLAMRCLHS